MNHQICAGILIGEWLMGVQPWWKSKSFIALAIICLVLIIWWTAIKPFIWITKKGE